MEFLSMNDEELQSFINGKEYFSDSMAIGTEEYTRFYGFLKNFVATDGVRDLCTEHKCIWINDVVGSYISTKKLTDSFYSIIFIVNEDSSCDFIAHDGNYNIIVHQNIEYTDLKQNLKLFLCFDETRWVLMLPSEY